MPVSIGGEVIGAVFQEGWPMTADIGANRTEGGG
jgi:hypothetical protein